MRRRPPRFTRTGTRFHYTTLFRLVWHVLAAVGADAGFGCRRGAAQFEAGAFARAGALVATTQFLKRHLPVEAVEAGPVQVRIGTADGAHGISVKPAGAAWRSEEHTSELQSLMRISYAVFCLNKKKPNRPTH